MIDFHVITRDQKKAPFLHEALFSLQDQSHYLIDNCPSIHEGRLQGYQMGSNPYVSFCDDDDYVHDIVSISEYITQNRNLATYTNSKIIFGKNTYNFFTSNTKHDNSMILKGLTSVHQLVVVERNIAIEAACMAIRILPSPLLIGFDYAWQLIVAKKVGWDYKNDIHYSWRKWDITNQAHNKCHGIRNQILGIVQDKVITPHK
jgi:hypothetical protein